MSQQRKKFKFVLGKHWIDGKLQISLSGNTFEVHNPATAEVIAHGAKGNQSIKIVLKQFEGDARDVDSAVSAATKAQKLWAAMPVRQRGDLVAK